MNRAPTFIIAEAGVNHNGDLQMALDLVDAAKESGADAVKFQSFKADRLVTRQAHKATYQKQSVPGEDTQYSMLKALEMSEADFRCIHAHCEMRGIEFLASPFDEESAAFLNALAMRTYKIPSGEITNLPLLKHIAAYGKPVILSTGMCHLAEVEGALTTLDAAGAGAVSLLHCVTQYPAPHDEINLSAMTTLARAFGREVGYSDHTAGIEIPVAAVAMGARIIEKHFTLDTALPGPDHAASLPPAEFRRMVQAIRHVEQAIGDGIKRPAPCEIANIGSVRKSIVAACTIAEGEVITTRHLTLKRPGTGVSPMLLDVVVGRRALRTIEVDQLIEWGDLA
ncbi:N-acetylneuraminate synthase [Halomonas marinisediminis]|uniref:N-acetylneuraminate synthase n=1 Tax=Halomonas marinisediminis TaxID=2546095 RepID=A0ABY2D3A3_9GAMM|nr:N-acetylneuraminate synthase [Halomonas marinisediminis]TDA95517.1 N-acetylneuraminate synthase [Halomonas marinisediminis]